MWYQFFCTAFFNIGGVFRYVYQSGGQVRKIAISLQWIGQFLHFWYYYSFNHLTAGPEYICFSKIY